MAETHGVYITTTSEDYLPVTCECCGEIIGSVVNIKDRPMLAINDKVIVFALDGICSKCGSLIHWRSGDVLFDKLMARLRNRGKPCVTI